MPDVKLYAKWILRDIREGLGDVPIMEKYQITPSQYMNVLEQLKDVEVARQRHGLVSRTAVQQGPHLRSLPRCYIFRDLSIREANYPDAAGLVNDMTENGIQVVGIVANIGEVKTFVIVYDHAGGRTEVSFDGLCRWIRSENDYGEYVAGYEITKISPAELRQLRRLIQELTLCDWVE